MPLDRSKLKARLDQWQQYADEYLPPAAPTTPPVPIRLLFEKPTAPASEVTSPRPEDLSTHAFRLEQPGEKATSNQEVSERCELMAAAAARALNLASLEALATGRRGAVPMRAFTVSWPAGRRGRLSL